MAASRKTGTKAKTSFSKHTKRGIRQHRVWQKLIRKAKHVQELYPPALVNFLGHRLPLIQHIERVETEYKCGSRRIDAVLTLSPGNKFVIIEYKTTTQAEARLKSLISEWAAQLIDSQRAFREYNPRASSIDVLLVVYYCQKKTYKVFKCAEY